jgi:hypothetical protein
VTSLNQELRNGNVWAVVGKLAAPFIIPALGFAFALGIAYQRIGAVEGEQADLKVIVGQLSTLVARHDERIGALGRTRER